MTTEYFAIDGILSIGSHVFLRVHFVKVRVDMRIHDRAAILELRDPEISCNNRCISIATPAWQLWLLLLTWLNFNLSMDK